MPGKTLKGALVGWALLMLLASHAAAAPAWLAPADLSAPGRDASNPSVAMDAAGDTVAAWERQSTTGPGRIVQISTRNAGAGFTAPALLSEAATQPQVAMTPAGEAIVAWWHFANPPGVSVLEVETRPAGGAAFSAPTPVKALPSGVIPGEPQLAVNASGDIALAWTSRDPESAVDPSANFIEAAVRPAGGSFSTPEAISPQPIVKEQSASLAGDAIDGAGEATVVWTYENATSVVVEAAFRPPGGPFSAPVEVNPPLAAGENAVAPAVATDAAGDATVVWVLAGASTDVVEAADRTGGGFAAPIPLSEVGEKSFEPEIATSPAGVTTVIWQRLEASNLVIQGSGRPATGAGFSPPEDVSAAAGSLFGPRLATNGSGEAVVVWSGSEGLEEVVQASVRKPGAGFGPAAEISATSPEPMLPAVALDEAGDATAVWPRSNGSNDIVQFAGYDASAPQLRGVSIPSTGTAGVPVRFSAAPFDVWPLAPAGFSFGDGVTASGNAVSHAYAKPGVYRVEVTATDGAGASATAAGRIEIGPRRDFEVGKLKRNRRKGTGTLAVTVGGPGRVVLSGPLLKKAVVVARAEGVVRVPVKARGRGLAILARRGRLTTRAKVSFNPDGGAGSTRAIGLKLIEKHG